MRKTPPPAPDRKWSPRVKAWWRRYWGSPEAAELRASDIPAVWRLFGWYHRREIYQAQVDDALVVKGSTGQERANPILDKLLAVDRQIEALEKKVYAPPVPGSAGGTDDPARLLAQANAAIVEASRRRGPRRSRDQDDPRLQVLDGGVGA